MPLAPQISASGKLFLLGSIFCPESWEQSAISPICFNGTRLLLAGLVGSPSLLAGTELNFTQVALDTATSNRNPSFTMLPSRVP